MKYIFPLFILSLVLFSCQSTDRKNNNIVESNFISAGATCTGSSSCKACKNCKYCKHCAKNGGTCGVCNKH